MIYDDEAACAADYEYERRQELREPERRIRENNRARLFGQLFSLLSDAGEVTFEDKDEACLAAVRSLLQRVATREQDARRAELLRSAEARLANHERAQFEAFRRFWEDQGYLDRAEPDAE